MMNKTINPNDVVGLYVSYLDGTGGKRRPVLIISTYKEELSFFRLTSQYESKTSKIRKQYYPIKHWKEAGLKKPSWIDVGSVLKVNRTHLDSVTKIGALDTDDIDGLAQFIKKIDYHK
ncbi:type II toxin-antitoxin system PemK/MazF family toxin [Alkalibacterium putridalgicola]|uniref:type II toxin-antitoxin system PemK/MazF family toxin n=1 Tax=Alkalibacterium putridalgicola TaxID=426703 RepID=UPI0034CFFE71